MKLGGLNERVSYPNSKTNKFIINATNSEIYGKVPYFHRAVVQGKVVKKMPKTVRIQMLTDSSDRSADNEGGKVISGTVGIQIPV